MANPAATPPAGGATLRAHDLTAGYARPVLRGLNFALRAGACTGLVGANGAGKSTLVTTLVGLLKPHGGRIDYTGRLGYMPQNAAVDWDFPATVADLVLMGRVGHYRWWPGRRDRAQVRQAMELTGISALADVSISDLSGGQRQRALLARTLAVEPDLLILDEPFAGVDQASQEAISEVLRGLEHTTILLVHHNLAEVAALCDDVILLGRGGILGAGPTPDTLTNEAITRLYGLPA